MFDALFKGSRKLLKRNCFKFRKVFYSDSSVVSASPSLKALEVADRVRNKQLFEKHFIENLFLNKFQNTILEYPEIETLKEVNSLKNHCSHAKKILAACKADSPENFSESETKKILNCLKKLQLTGFKVPLKNGGFGYQSMELCYMQEALSSDLALSKTVAENENFGIDAINFFGSPSQKEKYLTKLATGESFVCFAHLEAQDSKSFDPIFVGTKARLSSDGKYYTISGEKSWVYNANHADAIIFSASIIDDAQEKDKKKITFFLVDKNLDGIAVQEQKLGSTILKGVDVSSVSFNDVVLPVSCILGKIDEGDAVLKSLFSSSKVNSGAQCMAIMKKLLGVIINHCLNNKFFRKNKFEYDFFAIKVGHIVSRLYAVESMTYLVAGRMDSFHDPDLFLESLILKIFSFESLQYALRQTLEITDTEIYRNNDMQKIIEESLFFLASDYINNDLKLILSTAGCKHVLKHWNEMNAFKKLSNSLGQQDLVNIFISEKRNVTFTTSTLFGYVHPIFEAESFLLEDLVFRLKKCTTVLLKKYRENIFSRHLELNLLADLVINIYTVVAILGRASRAYCLGVRLQELDRTIIKSEILRIRTESMEIVNLINDKSFIETFKKINNNSFDPQSFDLFRSKKKSITSN